jgi:hypothetical protein
MLPEFLDRLLDGRSGFGQIRRNHGRRHFNAGVESQEPRFSDGRYLREIVHLDHHKAGTLPPQGDEVRRLGLLLFQNLRDHVKARLGGGVAGFYRNRNLK